ncbi:superoxide dismutase family protein [Ramlibacter sp. G-1-2-2]|uniref:Superoxide dismutase [Cu-Zn] n=1 Tax=Ramlibacter agri TaxID=2728837 RepID=A0A848H238_9BURK|nr:superoxide dismutase family protein [Ramlibacter agri]NML44885.1 superoxide dismutase family protein [Ramlibacter agri]
MNKTLLLPAVLVVALAGCASWWGDKQGAVATLSPTQGSTTSGIVKFEQRGSSVLVAGEVRGLPGSGENGFHIHEKGDCSSPDGSSAGGHWNPTRQPHGMIGSSPHHTGDLASLKPDANGVAHFSFLVENATIGGGGPNDILGKGVVVHRDRDDFTSQPAGNSGPRLACGPILRT